MRKHLITGSSGFFGNLLAHYLVRSGVSVRLLDINEDPSAPLGADFICCDIMDRDALRRAMKGIDVVHHLASAVPLTKSSKNFWQTNVVGSRMVAEEASQAGVDFLVNVSSSAVFGGVRYCPVEPDTPPHPAEPYGESKLAAERAMREVCASTGLPMATIRPRTILGRGRLGIFHLLFDWINQSRNIYTIGPGANKLQFVHADDLLAAHMLIANQRLQGVHHVGTNRFGTLKEDLQALIAHAGSQSRVVPLPVAPTIAILEILDKTGMSPLGPIHYKTYHRSLYFNVDPLLQKGWNPQYSNAQTLAESYDSFLRTKQENPNYKSHHRRALEERLLKVIKVFS